jgi:hypothetical protein
MWTTGTYVVSTTIPLNWQRRYLVTGYLTQTDGDDYAHVYISTVCTFNGSDVILCGVRDISDDTDLGVVEVLPNSAISVVIKLKTRGGRHRAEGVVYEL